MVFYESQLFSTYLGIDRRSLEINSSLLQKEILYTPYITTPCIKLCRKVQIVSNKRNHWQGSLPRGIECNITYMFESIWRRIFETNPPVVMCPSKKKELTIEAQVELIEIFLEFPCFVLV